jgi:hypothetical protein
MEAINALIDFVFARKPVITSKGKGLTRGAQLAARDGRRGFVL